MGKLEVLAIAVALAMDAFAVAVATGLRLRCSLAQTARMAGAFGLFQFAMPVLGWALGLSVRSYIEAFDHWVAFALLAFVGGKMLLEARKGGADECGDPTRGGTLVLLALATSIDALAVGVTFAFLQVQILPSVALIGAMTFALSLVGVAIGRRFGGWLMQRAQVAGGVVLVLIGLKILLEHLGVI